MENEFLFGSSSKPFHTRSDQLDFVLFRETEAVVEF